MRGSVFALLIGLVHPALAAAQVRAGGEFRVNTYTPYFQWATGLAVEPDGNFIVVWTSRLQDGHLDGVFGQRFTADGELREAEFRVSTFTMSEQRRPHVAVRPNGDFVVVWDHLASDQVIVYGRRFDRSGAPRGGEFRINEQSSFTSFARTALGPDGRFIVVWTGEDGDGTATKARVMGPTGVPLTSEFRVNTTTTGTQQLADVTALPDGGFVVVWEDRFGINGFAAILGQRLASDGSPVGAEFRIDDTGTAGHWARMPSVSAGPDGGFVVLWSDFEDTQVYDARGRRFDPQANPKGPSFVLHSQTDGKQYTFLRQVAHDEAGNFVVTWQGYALDEDRWSVFGQRFDAGGTRRGAEFRVDTTTTDTQKAAVMASDPAGNFVVAWIGYQPSPGWPETYAQRFGGLLPHALRVDTAANGVWEPGESIDLRPTWRNVNGAAQTMAGTLRDVQGPPPALYGITDAGADYGTIPNGAAVEAGDHYGVTVSMPPSRPALHWDASVLETLTPDVMGQVKRWSLHIGDSFTDVPRTNPFYRFVETLLHRGVTSGCGGTAYCPSGSTTREQMAPFVLVAKEGPYAPPACGTPAFPDVPASSPFCRWIEELARRGVVTGCGGGNYCPGDPVTREQMAIFVLRTLDPSLDPPPCTAPVFADVPAGSPFCRWIEELARRGVVTGCGGGNYCPTAPVTREEMSVFLAATFGLRLYGP